MALSNSQYNTIMHTYDMRQLESKKALDARMAEIYEKAPAYKEISESISERYIMLAKKLIAGADTEADLIRKQIADLEEEREAVLLCAGFSKGYDKPSYKCLSCKDTGFVDGVKCTCFRQLQAEMLFDASNIKELLKKENFSTFNFDYFDKKAVDPSCGRTAYEMIQSNYKVAKDMADNFKPGEKNLLFIGPAGTGKTFLSNCVAEAVIKKGYSVIYLSATSLFDKLADCTFGRHSDSDERDLIFDCDLLIIDDLGTEFNNTFVSSQLFYCLNERKLRKKSTIISTNLDMNHIRDAYSERVSSRLMESYGICKFFNSDIRIIKRREGI